MSVGHVPEELRRICEETPVFDTHEHQLPRSRMAAGRVGPADLIRQSYVSWAMGPVDGDRWQDFRDALELVRRRAFYVTWLEGMRDLYGFDGDLDAETWEALTEQVSANYEDPDWPRVVFKDRANVRAAILDQYWDHLGDDYDAELFAPCLRMNPLAFGFHPRSKDHNDASAHALAAKEGFELHDFADYEDFCRELVRRCKRAGFLCLKSAVAYDRDLRFDPARRQDAARVWGKDPEHASPEEVKVFGDYVVDLIASAAAEEGLPFQWHTGLGEGGGSNPMNLLGLIERHPDTRFILLHGGFPWCRQWMFLGMTYPNVTLDLTWLPVISPRVAVRTIEEMIDVVNADRICGGGGDSWTPEGAYGALKALRRTLGEALGALTRGGRVSVSQACELAEAILYGNAAKLYGVGALSGP